MHLKSLKLAGFKSFARPTTLRFGRHINAIVGPNGCGKSNVIDAIRWVLGESYAKQLRGGAMTDVIFAGTQSKAPYSVASVELVLAHTQDSKSGIRHALNLYDELVLRRQVTKEGKSAYFINGERVRRRDVVDIFLGTGLSSRGYAVIEQGMIGRIVEADGQSLRRLIEEAAGVSRYQARLGDTEKQLALAKNNLARLDDLQGELKAKQKHLKTQAKQADRYQMLIRTHHNETVALHQAKLFLAWQTHQRHLDQSKDLSVQHRRQGQMLDELQAKLSSQHQTIQTLISKKEHAFEQCQKMRLDVQALAHKKQQHQTQLQHAKQALTLLAQPSSKLGDIDHLTQQLHELENTITLAKSQLGDTTDAWHKAKAALDTLTCQAQSINNRLEVTEGTIKQLNITQQTQPPLPTVKPPSHDPDDLAKQLVLLEWRLDQLQKTNSEHQASLTKWQQTIADTTTAQARLEKMHATLLAERTTLQALSPDKSDQTILAQTTLTQLGECYSKALDDGLSFLWQDKVYQSSLDAEGGWWQGDGTGGISRHPSIVPLSKLVLTPPLRLFAHSYLVDLEAGGLALESIPVAALYQHLCQFVVGEPAGFIVAGQFVHRFGVKAAGFGEALQRQAARQKSIDTLGAKLQAIASEQLSTKQALSVQQAKCDELLCAYNHHKKQQKAVQDELTAMQQRHAFACIALERYQHAKQLSDELNKQHLHITDELSKQQSIHQALMAELLALTPAITEQTRSVDDLYRHTTAQKQQLSLQIDKKNKLMAELNWQKGQRAIAQATAQKNAKDAKIYQDQITALTLALGVLCDDENTLLRTQEKYQIQYEHQTTALADAQEALKLLQNQHADAERVLAVLADKLSQARASVAVALSRMQDHGETLRTLDRDFKMAQVLDGFASGQRVETDTVALMQRLDERQKQLDAMGAVNLAAKTELDELNARLAPLLEQSLDIQNSITTLQNASKSITQQTKKRFMATLQAVNDTFGVLFANVFDGGQASLQLDDGDLPTQKKWQAGLVLMAQPKGKKNSRLSVLSGGEKTLTALALIFAIFKQSPAPFCVLDEVDAPLDDANVARFTELIKELAQSVQFIFVSHNKLAMACADELIGVTMPTAGLSSVVSVSLDMAAAMIDEVGER